jgi:hypothetical protein
VSAGPPDGGQAVVLAIDPAKTVAAANPAVKAFADQVRTRLTRVLEKI